MIIDNRTDRYDDFATKSFFDIGLPYGYDYNKAQSRNIKQRVEFHLQDVANFAYFGALTFNNKSITNKFIYTRKDSIDLYGDTIEFTLPYNLQNIPATQKFFKRLQEQCRRLFSANLQHSFVCEQGEGGATHQDDLLKKCRVAQRGKNNNPHVHFILYSDIYINPHILNCLIKYYWQGHTRVVRSPRASFAQKYKYITSWNESLYGMAGLNMTVNSGMIDLTNSNSKFNTHTASGYLTSYLCKDFDFYEFKMKQYNAIDVQYCALFGSYSTLDKEHKDELESIHRSFSLKCLPRTLHSIGVGASAWLHRDENYKLPSYKDKMSSREPIGSYLRRKFLFDHVPHPFRTLENGKPLICYVKNTNYIDCALRSLPSNIDKNCKVLRTLQDHYFTFYKEYQQWCNLHNKNICVPRELTPLEISLASIYMCVYRGRRYRSIYEISTDYMVDFQDFLVRESLSGFRELRLFENPVKDLHPYSEHPLFSPLQETLHELLQFGVFYRETLTTSWMQQKRKDIKIRQSIKQSLGSRL